MELESLVSAYGIQPANLSPEVREGLNAILRVAGREAIAQVQEVLKKEAAKRGVQVGNTGPSAAEQQAVAQKALEAAQKAQEEADAKKKRQRVIIGIAAAIVVVIVIIVAKKR